jgi:hypothetical protein
LRVIIAENFGASVAGHEVIAGKKCDLFRVTVADGALTGIITCSEEFQIIKI